MLQNEIDSGEDLSNIEMMTFLQNGLYEHAGNSHKKYAANIVFSGSENKLIGDRVKFENDSLCFHAFIEGQDISVKVKCETETKMAGKAVYSEGVIPLSLTREMKKE